MPGNLRPSNSSIVQDRSSRIQVVMPQGRVHHPMPADNDFSRAVPTQYFLERGQQAGDHLNASPLHNHATSVRVPANVRVASTVQEAIPAETFAIGAAILRIEIPYVMPCIHIAANGTMTVTWVRV